MIGELLGVPGALGAFALAVLIFGFAPGFVLALVVRLIPDPDRRAELQAELYTVPRYDRPFWVAQQFEVALRVGLSPRVEWMWDRYVWHRCKLESGIERHREAPISFWIPDDDEKAEVRPGDAVKLMWSVRGLPGERMWVKVTHRHGDHFVGAIDNYPVCVYRDFGETVSFHVDHIIGCDFYDEEIEAA